MKKGFTLAEVLITLGIIGIVAAMTLPTLIQNFQKLVVENQLKVAYSLISNAIKMAEVEYGTGFNLVNNYADGDTADVNGYSYEFSEEVAEQYFKPYIKTLRSYSKNENNKFRWRGFKDQNYITNYNMKCYDIVNGMSMCIMPMGNVDSTINFFIFLKPSRKEKITGKDVFNFTFRKKNKGTYFGYQIMSDDYSPSRRQEFIDGCVSPESYPISCWGKDAICTFLIWKNNFKIPDDYPVKF